jgi:primosomal protein N' (replication factor Y) (superfamily II helicase)
MYVVSVAPIKRGIPIDELSYFTKEVIPPGALVRVPLRGKSVHAIVLRSIPAAQAKSEIKQAEFALKRLEHVTATTFFRPEFITAATLAAQYFAASTGATVQSLFPNSLLSPDTALPTPIRNTGEAGARKGARAILQAEEVERFATYKSHIREVFARGHSCYFVLPSMQEIEHAYARLEKGIQEYTFVLHSGLTRKELEKRWNAIAATTHPVLIIGTPLFLTAPRNDITSIILDQESSGAYKQQARPFIDMRYFVERFADAAGADLILGDLFLRVETLFRKENGEFEPLLRPKSRITSEAMTHLIDMRTSGEQPATGRIAIASRELVDLIEETRKKGTHCFILGVRRGFAPMTVCGDCGTVVSCTECSAPLVLHRKSTVTARAEDTNEESPNIYLCHRCGRTHATKITCTHCGGWRLVPLGIGLTQAEESIAQRFPDATIFRLDRDSIKKHSEAKKLVEKFYQTPGSILLGTEMALPYLTEPVGTVAVLSVNSLLTIPDFRMGERVFRLLLKLREKAREHFLVQTRDPDVPLFELAMQGNIGEFIQAELDVRKRLNYPPYATLLKFTHEGTKQDGETIMKNIAEIFGTYHPVTFPGFIARVKGRYHHHALIKIPAQEWPNEELAVLVRSLPTEIAVRVNPDSVI